MAPGDHQVPYNDLNIGGQVVSTLHGRPHKTTHFNTVRAQHRTQIGNTTRAYITTSRNRIYQMRDTGNIIPLERGHMRLSPQARKTMNLVVSDPELTSKQRAKCVNALAGVFTKRSITRDRSVLEVAAAVTGSTFSSRPSRVSRPPPVDRSVPQGPAAGPPALGNIPQQSAEPLPELVSNRPDEITDELQVSTLLVEKLGPSQKTPTRRTITRHGTEVLYGLVTPGISPIKAPGEQPISTVIEQDVEMSDTLMGDHGRPSTPSPGSDLGSSARRETEPSDMVSAWDEIASLRQEKAYVLQKLSRNGQGTISNIETVVDRAVRQRDELRAENQKLRADIQRLEFSVIELKGKIAHTQDKLNRVESEKIEMTHSRRQWITRMWAFAGRIPGELRKKDAEIDHMREKLSSMHARLSQEQSELQNLQVQLEEERKRRMGVEVELDGSKLAHAQEIKDRDFAGRRLRDQLNQLANGLDSGIISI